MPIPARLTRRATLGLATLALTRHEAAAQSYPSRIITIVTGYAPGGGTDVAARILADAMPQHLGSAARIVVENRPGGAGTVATEWLSRQAPDGYTLMLTETGAAITAPVVIIGGTRYDPIDDFTHLGFVSRPPAVMVVTPSIAAPKPQETLRRLRAAPRGSLSYASSGFGGTIHIWGEMVSRRFDLEAVHVPYRSGGQMVQSIMTGETQYGVSSMASAVPMIREGRIKPVALVGDGRFQPLGDIPTFGEIGFDGFEMGSNFMLVGPPRMPADLAATINRSLVAVLADAGVRERLLIAGLPAAAPPNGVTEARQAMQEQLARMKTIVEQTGIRVQA